MLNYIKTTNTILQNRMSRPKKIIPKSLLSEEVIEEFHNYVLRLNKSNEFFKTSIKVSTKELVQGLSQLVQHPNSTDFILILKDIIGSTAWITNSWINLAKTATGKNRKVYGNIGDRDGEYIIDKIVRNIKIDPKEFSNQQIFNAIYRELDFAHHNPKYNSPLAFPKIFPTIVLVSGVMNELYKTAAFERGVSHLSSTLGFKYFVARTHGLRSSSYNVKLLEEQLFEYCLKNKDEKFWLISYSKGGIDSLHFLAKNSEWASRNIAGISTIASPILGSAHLNHKVLKLINTIHLLDKTSVYKLFTQNKDFLAKEFQQSLDHKNQSNWFRQNYHKLPTNIFYTALGLEADWYESHIYMILTKLFFPSKKANDGIVDSEHAFFPHYFSAFNLGIIKGHHLIGARSSSYSQEALIASHIVFLKYLHLV